MDDLTRYVNATMAGIGMVVLVWRLVTAWSRISPRLRLYKMSMASLLFTGLYGSIEAATVDAPLGFRTYVAGVAYMWVLLALFVTPRTPIRPHLKEARHG